MVDTGFTNRMQEAKLSRAHWQPFYELKFSLVIHEAGYTGEGEKYSLM